MSLPACELVVEWSRYFNSSGGAAGFYDDAQALAEAMIASPVMTFAGFSPARITKGGLTAVVTEPLTMETRFVSRTSTSGTASQPTEMFLAPAMKVSKQVSVVRHVGLWVEHVVGAMVGSRAKQLYCSQLAKQPGNRLTYEKRALQLGQELALLRAQDQYGHLPLSLVAGNGDSIQVSCSGVAWPDTVTGVVFPRDQLAGELAAIICVGMSADVRAVAEPQVKAKVQDAVASVCTGVDVGLASGRTLSSNEQIALRSFKEQFFLMPSIVFDVVGAGTRVMTVPAMLRAIDVIYAELVAGDAVEYVVDTTKGARSIAELMRGVIGPVDARFLDSIDAVYRRGERPEVPNTCSQSLQARIATLHPILIPEAQMVGDREVVFTESGVSWTGVYSDQLGTGYSLLSGSSRTASVQALSRYHAFINSAFGLLVSQLGTSPSVLEQLGVPGVQRGWAFALSA